MPKIYEVVLQRWEESERGWGTRPDGYSLHLTAADLKAFIKDYWDSMPDQVQDEYSRPDGLPRFVHIDAKTYRKIKATKNGYRGVDPIKEITLVTLLK